MIGWGIIGCGDVTEVKSGPPLSRVAGSRLVHVMRRQPALAADYARRHGVPRWSTDAAEVLKDPDVDVVYIATPPASHHDYVVAAARAGKHVLVEKVMGTHAPECDAMIDACSAAGVRLWVAYYRRYLPRFTAVVAAVQAGAIGQVRATQTTWRDAAPVDLNGWRWNPEQNRGGVFYETSCHTLDFLDLLVGPLVGVSGHSTADLTSVVGCWTTETGVVGTGSWQFGVADPREDTVVIGTEGTVTFSSIRADPIRLVRGDEVTSLPIADPPHVHEPLIESIVGELSGGPPCVSTGVSGARTNAVMDAILGWGAAVRPGQLK